MIDWVTAIIPLEHEPLKGGSVIKVSPDGDIEWEAACRLSVPGSHEESITVRSQGSNGAGKATELYISGNPSKYLQGHNVFGSDDLRMLVFDTFVFLCGTLKLPIPPVALNAVWQGDYRLTRVDINYMYSLGTQSDVKSFIRAAEFKSKTRHGRPSSKAGTLYYGKSSRRYSIKMYSKLEEISASGKHRLSSKFKDTPIREFAEDKLRVELTLRGKELDEISHSRATTWRVDTPQKLFCQYIERIEMNQQIALSTDMQNKLPHRLKTTYINWQAGFSPRESLCRQTFYRHRKELLEYGIDINLAVDKEDRSNVVPLVRILEAKPADIPAWAYDLGLVHGSKRRLVANG